MKRLREDQTVIERDRRKVSVIRANSEVKTWTVEMLVPHVTLNTGISRPAEPSSGPNPVTFGHQRSHWVNSIVCAFYATDLRFDRAILDSETEIKAEDKHASTVTNNEQKACSQGVTPDLSWA
ncbi:hypothetical protein RRG08_022276 [Elysia crispata]|uniref:Uncharacterized protein n=1 Tax=Elysia crispata TaxID=231223 RepID=A0AAE1DK37_9GAST|nr:hypothetical protein RRG08_022276 [Elysia crispata]